MTDIAGSHACCCVGFTWAARGTNILGGRVELENARCCVGLRTDLCCEKVTTGVCSCEMEGLVLGSAVGGVGICAVGLEIRTVEFCCDGTDIETMQTLGSYRN